jgi:hypothetical protein
VHIEEIESDDFGTTFGTIFGTIFGTTFEATVVGSIERSRIYNKIIFLRGSKNITMEQI